MHGKETQNAQTDPLADLIAFDSKSRAVWPAAELMKALHQHLHARLFEAPAQELGGDWSYARALAAYASPPIRTFMHLLHHPTPPPELLSIGKDLAKRQWRDARNPLPPEVWQLLYYGCIVAAMVRCNQRITRLSDDELRRGLNWAVRQPWVDGANRNLLMDGLRALRSPSRLWRR